MNNAEFKQAFAIADIRTESLLSEDISQFDGFGLKDFHQCTCTIRQLAALIRWQGLRFNGTWDNEALHEIRTLGRQRFMVVG